MERQWEGCCSGSQRLILQAGSNRNRIVPSDVGAGMDDRGGQMSVEAKDYLKAVFTADEGCRSRFGSKAKFPPSLKSSLNQTTFTL